MEAMNLILAQSQPNDLSAALFYVFAAVTMISAVGVVASRNIVRTAVWLLLTLLGVGALYFLLQAEFLAAVQLVVYAGGTLVLIVFGVMLTSKSPFSRFEPTRKEVIIASVLGGLIFAALCVGILVSKLPAQSSESGLYPMLALGQALLGDYLIPFELASVVLLVVMIGAAYLAKGRKREP